MKFELLIPYKNNTYTHTHTHTHTCLLLFRGLKQVLFLELGLTKENDNFMYILLDIVCK